MHFTKIELHLVGVFYTINTTIRGSSPRELATGAFYCLPHKIHIAYPCFNYSFPSCLIIKHIDSKLLSMLVNFIKT
jgi:hypothetical protein